MASQQTINLNLAGATAVLPANATAALINLTVDFDATMPSYLTVWPQGEPRPLASANNAEPGLISANSMLAKLGTTGGISIFNQQGAVNLVIDVVGYTIALADAGLDHGGHLLSGNGAPSNSLGDD
ncbi:MAG TPA: hypothetical protein PLV68_10855, partial [Ilumatobacteraceae bacterium]|nr:hypothetical protein [Ilumatobacteraceae bacterium]